MSSKTTYTFRPALWAILLVVLLSAGMVWAGCWQLSRGQQKQAMQAARAQESTAIAKPLLDDPSPPAAGLQRRVVVQGMYAPALTVQLDNQSHLQTPGVHAWTPMVLMTGEHVVVDRGWLPLGADMSPPPEGVQRIEGNWKRLPVPGMRLGDAPQGCSDPRPERVNYPDLAQVRCLFGHSTLDGLLELGPEEPGGFLRDWAKAGVNEISPSRHFGYAAQWWLFAVTLVALFIKINLKRNAAHD